MSGVRPRRCHGCRFGGRCWRRRRRGGNWWSAFHDGLRWSRSDHRWGRDRPFRRGAGRRWLDGGPYDGTGRLRFRRRRGRCHGERFGRRHGRGRDEHAHRGWRHHRRRLMGHRRAHPPDQARVRHTDQPQRRCALAPTAKHCRRRVGGGWVVRRPPWSTGLRRRCGQGNAVSRGRRRDGFWSHAGFTETRPRQ